MVPALKHLNVVTGPHPAPRVHHGCEGEEEWKRAPKSGEIQCP
jgi:hypothetical protein